MHGPQTHIQTRKFLILFRGQLSFSDDNTQFGIEFQPIVTKLNKIGSVISCLIDVCEHANMFVCIRV